MRASSALHMAHFICSVCNSTQTMCSKEERHDDQSASSRHLAPCTSGDIHHLHTMRHRPTQMQLSQQPVGSECERQAPCTFHLYVQAKQGASKRLYERKRRAAGGKKGYVLLPLVRSVCSRQLRQQGGRSVPTQQAQCSAMWGPYVAFIICC
jgi:hypothetical protein